VTLKAVCRALGLSLVVAAILAGFPSTGSAQQTIFFTENFGDANFASRGWYDVAGGTIDPANHVPGSAASFNCHWAQGGTKCAGGTPGRHKFTASPTVYVSFWMKLGSATVTWQGSGKPYHPHMIYLLTDADGDFVGPAWCNLEFLIEPSLFTPRLAATDGKRINTGQLGVNLLGTATPHAIGGGNGSQNASSTYYSIGGGNYANGTLWDSASANFLNDTWHHVEVYAAMNSILGGIPQADGIIKFWVDGTLVVDQANVYLRTAQFATQKFNQFLLSPYIGDGSPIAQDLWIDNLVVADQPPASHTVPAPKNLRVIP